jgi:hypothetical protein
MHFHSASDDSAYLPRRLLGHLYINGLGARYEPLCRLRGERAHTGEVVGRLSQREHLLGPLAVAIHGLPDAADRRAPAKDLLDAFVHEQELVRRALCASKTTAK